MAINLGSIVTVGRSLLLAASPVFAQWTFETKTTGIVAAAPPTTQTTENTAANVLSQDEWRRVDAAVKLALNWLVRQQQPDGSFPTIETGQPGVTSLCIMAFMAHGHVPSDGEFGKRIERAADYVLRCQKRNGLVSLLGPDGPRISRFVPDSIGETACYDHAISSLMLSELYGMSESPKSDRMQKAIANAIVATLEMQRWPKNRVEDRGGWRDLDTTNDSDSDLSVTGWQLMFLRSARNGGFDVPAQPIDDAVAYVRRCFDPQYGVFDYSVNRGESRSRGMAGAGILAPAHAGLHGSTEAKVSGNWVIENSFEDYNAFQQSIKSWRNDRYHYSMFTCSQGMYQLGGRYWADFFPQAVATLLANQRPDGSWPAERYNRDGQYGNAYTTALVLLSLGAPNQLLPIFQR